MSPEDDDGKERNDPDEMFVEPPRCQQGNHGKYECKYDDQKNAEPPACFVGKRAFDILDPARFQPHAIVREERVLVSKFLSAIRPVGKHMQRVNDLSAS
ncbi:hypothetical protein [Propionivibrio limicola]|uniref:hypothetical protein n=1 Tax=Propionivibrio limicola TaxID=167645 RepID=UPI001478F4C1|nr:hypothetical protein [Propionivibrio limicola]